MDTLASTLEKAVVASEKGFESDNDVFIASIAVSLKRIADSLSPREENPELREEIEGLKAQLRLQHAQIVTLKNVSLALSREAEVAAAVLRSVPLNDPAEDHDVVKMCKVSAESLDRARRAVWSLLDKEPPKPR